MAEQYLDYYHPQEFSIRHKHVVALRAAGLKNTEIEEATGYKPATISKILSDPRAKKMLQDLSRDFIEQLTKDTQEAIQGTAFEAFEKVRYLMRSAESERVQQTSAFDILDRGGFKPREQSVSTQIRVSSSDIERLISALEESKEEPEELEMVQDSSGVFRSEDDITSARK